MEQSDTHAYGQSTATQFLAVMRARAAAISRVIVALEACIALDIDTRVAPPAAPAEAAPQKVRKAWSKPPRRISPPPTKRVPHGRAADPRDAVIVALRGMGRPMATVEIATAAGLPQYLVQRVVKALVKAKCIVKTGATTSLRYSLPPPAPGRSKADDNLVPVWDGTKERAGVAPKLADMGRT